jgi:hypothetical protein
MISHVQADGLNVSRVLLYNLDYGPSTQIPPAAPPVPPSSPSVRVPPPDRRPPAMIAGGTPPAQAQPPAAAASQSQSRINAGLIGGAPLRLGFCMLIAAAFFARPVGIASRVCAVSTCGP